MKEIFIVSRGTEVARVSHDSKTKKTLAKTFAPVGEEESNRCNCLSITVHTLTQLKEAGYKDKITMYNLNLVANMIGRMINAKKAVEAITLPEGNDKKEVMFNIFAKDMELSEVEAGLWKQFIDLNDDFKDKLLFKKVAYCKVTDEANASDWALRLHNLAKSAWERLPEVEASEIVEDDAV